MKKKALAFFLACMCIFNSLPLNSHRVYAKDEDMRPSSMVADLKQQAQGKYKEQDKIEIILDIDNDTMKEKHGLVPGDMSRLKTKEGLDEQLNYARESHKCLLQVFDNLGLSYEVKRHYDTLLNGLCLSTSYKDALIMADQDEVHSVKINGNIPAPRFFLMPRSMSGRQMIKIEGAEKRGYTGKGSLIAIIDSGADAEHEAFKELDANGVKIATENDLATLISQKGLAKGKFFSSKIPFGFNYADRSTNIKQGALMSHGMHVAGIIGANGGSQIKGIAPDAQLAIMRVFSDGGLGTTHDIYNMAIDDAVKLGADAINMSLGSTGISDSRVDVTTKEAFKRAKQAGIAISTAAGNDGYMGWGIVNKPKNTTPNYGLVNSPSVIESSLSVASINNTKIMRRGILTKVEGQDKEKVLGYVPAQFGGELASELVSYVHVNHGYEKDYDGKDLKGKYALIQRGHDPDQADDFTFKRKIDIAQEKGASGAIIYNDQKDSLAMAGLEEIKIPACIINKEDGAYLVENAAKAKIRFQKEYKLIDNDQKYKMSDFSSWGLSEEGNLKPDITAPGGDIYSSVNSKDGESHYEVMSGTSMAAPHVAAGISLVKKYVEDKGFVKSPEEVHGLVKNLLMSTADPIRDGNDSSLPYISPRNQGAGLMNLDKATQSTVVVEGTNKISSLALKNISGDKVSISGSLRNYGNQEVEFTYFGVLNTDKVENGYVLLKPRELTNTKESPKTIKVPAKGSQNFALEMTLSEDQKSELKRQMPKGYFLEGFVFFKAKEGQNQPEISMPFVGFSGGKWVDLEIIERPIYELNKNGENPYYMDSYSDKIKPFTHLETRVGADSIVLGEEVGSSKDKLLFQEKLAFSPNKDGRGDYIRLVATFLKSYSKVNVEVVKDGSNTPIFSAETPAGMKNFFLSNPFIGPNLNTSHMDWQWSGQSSNGSQVEEGQYEYRVKAQADGGEGKGQQTISIPVYLDRTIPRIVKSSFDESSRVFTIEKILEEGSGIKALKLLYNGEEISPQEEIKDYNKPVSYIIPQEKNLEDITLILEDKALNQERVPLNKAIRNGDERIVYVNGILPKNTGAIDGSSIKWKITNKEGEEQDPFNLREGSYYLTIVDYDEDKYVQKDPNPIHFTIGANEYIKTISVNFDYKDKIPVDILVNNRDKAHANIVLKDRRSGEEYPFKENHTVYTALVPFGEYSLLVKDTQEGYIALIEGEDIIEVNRKLSFIPKTTVKILPSSDSQEIGIKLERNGCSDPVEIQVVGVDTAEDYVKYVNFAKEESEKTISLPKNMDFRVYMSDLEDGQYGYKGGWIRRGSMGRELKIKLEEGIENARRAVNKKALALEISLTEGMNSLDYKDGWEQVQEALARAKEVFEDPEASQSQVKQALDELIEAKKNLLTVIVDESQLREKIEEAERLYSRLQPEEATENEKKYLKAAIDGARQILFKKDPKEKTSEKLQAQVELLDRAMENVINSEPKVREELGRLLEKAERRLNQVEDGQEDPLKDLKEAYDFAKEEFEDKHTSKDRLYRAIKMLKETLHNLKVMEGEDDWQGEKYTVDLDLLKAGKEEESSAKKFLNPIGQIEELEDGYRYSLSFDRGQGSIGKFAVKVDGKYMDAEKVEGTDTFAFVLGQRLEDTKLRVKFQIDGMGFSPEADLVLGEWMALEQGYEEEDTDNWEDESMEEEEYYEEDLEEANDPTSEWNEYSNQVNQPGGMEYNSPLYSEVKAMQDREKVIPVLNKPREKVQPSSLMDIKGHWAEKAIEYTVEKGYFVGTSESTYSPNAAISGAEFITVLARRSGVSQDLYGKQEGEKYYQAYLRWAVGEGMTKGIKDFGPEKPLNREEMALILNHYLGLGSAKKGNIKDRFKDIDHVSPQGKAAIESLVSNGILVGSGNDSFSPKKHFTRAQVAQVLLTLDQK